MGGAQSGVFCDRLSRIERGIFTGFSSGIHQALMGVGLNGGDGERLSHDDEDTHSIHDGKDWGSGLADHAAGAGVGLDDEVG